MRNGVKGSFYGPTPQITRVFDGLPSLNPRVAGPNTAGSTGASPESAWIIFRFCCSWIWRAIAIKCVGLVAVNTNARRVRHLRCRRRVLASIRSSQRKASRAMAKPIRATRKMPKVDTMSDRGRREGRRVIGDHCDAKIGKELISDQKVEGNRAEFILVQPYRVSGKHRWPCWCLFPPHKGPRRPQLHSVASFCIWECCRC